MKFTTSIINVSKTHLFPLRQKHDRRGAATVEFAIVAPVLILLVLA